MTELVWKNQSGSHLGTRICDISSADQRTTVQSNSDSVTKLQWPSQSQIELLRFMTRVLLQSWSKYESKIKISSIYEINCKELGYNIYHLFQIVIFFYIGNRWHFTFTFYDVQWFPWKHFWFVILNLKSTFYYILFFCRVKSV